MSAKVISDSCVKSISGGCNCICQVIFSGTTFYKKVGELSNMQTCYLYCAYIKESFPYNWFMYSCI